MGRFMEDVNTDDEFFILFLNEEFNSRKFYLHLTFKANWNNREDV